MKCLIFHFSKFIEEYQFYLNEFELLAGPNEKVKHSVINTYCSFCILH